MAWQLTPYALPHFVTVAVMIAVAWIAAGNRDTRGAGPLALLTAATAFWALMDGIGLVRTGLGPKLLTANLKYVAIVTIPVLFLYFAVEYTDRETPLTRFGLGPLLVLPALTQVVVWTNPGHHLMWTSRTLDTAGSFVGLTAPAGPWFWVHSAYSYLLVAAGTYLLVRTLVVSDHFYRGQSAAIVLGVIAPWISNAVFITDVVVLPFDPTPIAFAVTGVAFLFAIFRRHLLDLTPIAREIARDELMNNLVEGVFVLDDDGRIVDFNDRAASIVEVEESALMGSRLADVVPDTADALRASVDCEDVSSIDCPTDGDEVRTEIALRQNGTLRHFDVRVSRLSRAAGLVTGSLVSLRDVTERRQREQRLDVLNRALRHDLRNEANVILGYAELGMQNNPDAEWIDAIQEHVTGMVDLSAKVRQIEQALDGENVDPKPVDVVAVVDEVVEAVEAEYPDVSIGLDLPETEYAAAIDLVDAALQNAVENAVEHNDNPAPLTDVSVTVRRDDDAVTVEIADNGPGIHADEREVLLRGRETQLDHVSGLGLWIINWIVTESGGEIELAENDPRGTIVSIRLPTAEPPEPADATAERADGPEPASSVDLP